MQQTCPQCSASFTVSSDEQEVLKRLDVPIPTICRKCSEQLRYSFRNELKLYKRTCDATGETIISIYAPDSPFTVYKREVWLSDKYNPLDYGRDYDFSRGFFEQFRELQLAAPHEHMVIINCENCDYCNMIMDSKNCYLSVRILAEDVSYCFLAIDSKDCVDCHSIEACEICYECIDCFRSHNCHWCQRCKQCSDSRFCIDCTGCKDCFGCVGLKHKQHCIYNEQFTSEEYKKIMQTLDTSSHTAVEDIKKKVQKLNEERPQRFAHIEQSEDADGDYIMKSRNVHRSFDVIGSEDIYDAYGIEYCKDMVRSTHHYRSELGYEFLSSVLSQNIRYTYGSYDSHDIEYSMMVHQGSHHCFGCVGLKKNSYCILNKQYSKEEYEDLRERIIQQMKDNGEYEKFFPKELSHFAYNESYAQHIYPLTKEEALAKGYRWKDNVDEMLQAEKSIPAEKLPDAIKDIPDDILNWAIICPETQKPFRITKNELAFYRRNAIPVPHIHPDRRHLDRTEQRGSQELFERQCAKCGADIQTTYSPDRPETVFCEKCYLDEVY